MALHRDTPYTVHKVQTQWDSWTHTGKGDPFPSKEAQGTFAVGKNVWMKSRALSGGTRVDRVQG